MVAEENRDRCKITLKVKQESVLELKKVFFCSYQDPNGCKKASFQKNSNYNFAEGKMILAH